MATAGIESELGGLQQQARELAKLRRETATSGHLLAAVAAAGGPAATLFRDRRLDVEELLRASRSATDEVADPLRWACLGAEKIAQRMRAQSVCPAHMVVALLSDRKTAAFRALEQLGVDVSRLRLAAMNQALGQLGREPLATRTVSSVATGRRSSVASGASSKGAGPSRAQLVSPEEFRDLRDRARQNAAKKQEPVVAKKSKASTKPSTEPSEAKPSRSPKPTKGATALGPFELPKKKFPLLNELGRNLTLAAHRGELERAICRDAEVDQVLDVLAKRFGNNPCVVGPAGVGKTRVVQAVAQRIAEADGQIDQYIVVEVSAGALVAGTAVRGGLAARMQKLIKEVNSAPAPVVLFVDEIHQLFSGDGGEELTSEFKLAVSQGGLSCIGATTQEEFARTIEKDPALLRRFSSIEIEEPSREDAYLILESIAERFEAHHQVKFARDALALSVAWSVKYLSGRALPDKAISVVDLSGARARRRGIDEVGAEQVAEVVAEMTDVPVERLLQTDGERMLRLEEALATRVVGHEECLKAIAGNIRRNAVGLSSRRPIGTFLLLGPTGVGKTETAKALAEALFFSEHAMTRVDLSEYSEAHSVARLIGAPPGYVGHESGGQLTEAVRRRPYQVLLLDELEKAHDDVLASFLGVFDEGRMTDGRGRTVDFTNTVIVMTSNLGARDVESSRSVGFQRSTGGGSRGSSYRDRIIPEVRKALAPELYNRLDDVLVFEPLRREQICAIAERLLQSLCKRLRDGRGVHVEVAQSAMDCLIEDGGADLTLGARPMQRTIARLVENPLAELILRGDAEEGDRIVVRAREFKICFEVESNLDRSSSAAE